MIFLLKAILLWLSVFGYCTYLRKYMKEAFTPVVTLSSIGVLIFFAGFLNVMPATVYLILLGGWVCFIIDKPWKREFWISNKVSIEIFLMFSIICVLFLVRIYGLIPLHYDSFSHWLTVIHDMLNADRMPNFTSPLIVMQGYPTGAAGFIYFVCKILGKFLKIFFLCFRELHLVFLKYNSNKIDYVVSQFMGH